MLIVQYIYFYWADFSFPYNLFYDSSMSIQVYFMFT